MAASFEQIPNQVTLPLRVAIGVVAQGIRIRLGRSLVTLTGVVLGIAFLMSTLTAQLLKSAVADEDRLREQASRMYGYLVAESGSFFGRPVAVVATAPPSPLEMRLLARLEREGVSEFRWWRVEPPPLPTFERSTPKLTGSPAELGRGVRAVLILGSGPLPPVDWDAVYGSVPRGIFAVTAARAAPSRTRAALEVVRLDREASAEERAKLAAELRRERFRGAWIIVISLVVTVIGISNAMLMSTTERFREIGTMKCLGATSRFVRRLFLLEASFMGVVGGAVGILAGALFAMVTYLLLYGFALVAQALLGIAGALALAAAGALVASVVVSVIAGIYPAHVAAAMVPAAALRSNL